jgi:ABC-type lipoprotein release transport system permease subunit
MIFGRVDTVIEDVEISDADIRTAKEVFSDSNGFLYRNKQSVRLQPDNAEVCLIGIDLAEESVFFGYEYVFGGEFADNAAFYGSGGIIVTESVLEKLGLSGGAAVSIVAGGETVELPVAGVIRDIPLGEYVFGVPPVYISREYLIGLFGLSYNYNTILVDCNYTGEELDEKAKDYASYGSTVYTFGDLMKNQEAMIETASLLLDVFKTVVSVLGFFLIVITYKILLNGRMRTSGLLRSLGVSEKRLTALYLSESFLLGASAVVAGVFLGGGLTGLLMRTFEIGYKLPSDMPLNFLNLKALITSAVLGVVMPCAASVAHIVKSSAEKITQMIKYNDAEDTVRKKRVNEPLNFALGVAVFVAEVALFFSRDDFFNEFLKENTALLLGMIALFMFSVYLIIPFIIKIIGKAAGLISEKKSLKKPQLSLKMFGKNRIQNSAGIFIVALSLIAALTVGSLTRGYRDSVDKNVDSLYKFDYVVYNTAEEYGFSETQMNAVSGLSDFIYYDYGVFARVPNSANYGENFLAVHADGFFANYGLKFVAGNRETVSKELKEVWKEDGVFSVFPLYNCIITEDYAKVKNLKLGNTFVESMFSQLLRVCGVIESDLVFQNLVIFDYGMVAENLDTDIGRNILFVKDKNGGSRTVDAVLKEQFGRGQYNVITNRSIKESYFDIMKETETMLNVLNAVILIVVVIALANICYVKINERKSQLLLLKCMGGTRSKVDGTLIFEFLISLIISAAVALVYSVFLIKIVGVIFQSYFGDFVVVLKLSPSDLLVYAAVFAAVVFAATKLAAKICLKQKMIVNLSKGE